MGIIVPSLIVVVMGGLAAAFLVCSAKGRRKYQEFLVATKAIIRVSSVEDIDAALQGFEAMEEKHGFHFVSALKSLDSTWIDVGMPHRLFEDILAALILSQEALRVANDTESRKTVEEARRQLVIQIVLARQSVNQQAVLGLTARIGNITDQMLAHMH